MRYNQHRFGFLVVFVVAVGGASQAVAATLAESDIACEVTKPNGVVAGSEQTNRNSYGNQQLSLGPFGLWPDGTVVFRPAGAGFITRDGSLGMKFGWTRGIRGNLRIEGRRLDGAAPPLRSVVPRGYAESGFQPTYLVFSAPGCWEIKGRVDDASLTFVTRVVKIGDGPAWRHDPF